MPAIPSYRKPNWILTRIANPAIMVMFGRLGLGPTSANVLEVRGRTSGATRRVPVTTVDVEGQIYLVAPRGETDWVRNLRAAESGALVRGRKRQPFVASEVNTGDRVPILRKYLKENKIAVSALFDVRGPDATEADFAAIAANHPTFRIDFTGR